MKMTRSNKNSTVLGAVRAVVIGAVCGAVLCAGLLALFAFGFVKASYIPQFAINPSLLRFPLSALLQRDSLRRRFPKRMVCCLGQSLGFYYLSCFCLRV